MKTRENRYYALWFLLALVIMAFGCTLRKAHARDLGQWENGDPAVREWYKSLMQPDMPLVPCCGEADGYWADEVHVRDGKTYATITDDRVIVGRPHIPNGTEFEIPSLKLKWDSGNPTGHNVLFISTRGSVYCFVQGSGT